MELKKLTIDSPDIPALEEINEEAIPECERNSFIDLMNTGATILGIYEDGPVGFLIIREYKSILYLAYLAVNSSLRSKGIGGKALNELVSDHSDHMIVVEYEAPDPASSENESNIRRKGFYKRNGFCETGYFTFYDDTEFEIGCAGMDFDAELFGEFTEYLSTIVSDHIPRPYKKAMTPSVAEMIREGMTNNSIKSINVGQSGADVFEVDGTKILKHVIRDKIDNGMFDTYVKEALFYQAKCPKTYLPEVENLEILPDEIIIIMKKYNSLNRTDFSEDLLKKIAGLLSCIHSEPAPEFLIDHDKKSNALSKDDIFDCEKGWHSVLSEHPGSFDDSRIDNLSKDINDIITWHESEKKVLSHGDFHWDNILTAGKDELIVCDWQEVGLRGASDDLSFFMSRLSADGISVDSHCFLKWYTLEYNRLTGEAVEANELERHIKAANVITSFRFWHNYLHGNNTERVRGIFDKMVSDYQECWNK